VISRIRIIIENPTNIDVNDFEIFPDPKILTHPQYWMHDNYVKDGVTITLDPCGDLWKVKTYKDFIRALKSLISTLMKVC